MKEYLLKRANKKLENKLKNDKYISKLIQANICPNCENEDCLEYITKEEYNNKFINCFCGGRYYGYKCKVCGWENLKYSNPY